MCIALLLERRKAMNERNINNNHTLLTVVAEWLVQYLHTGRFQKRGLCPQSFDNVEFSVVAGILSSYSMGIVAQTRDDSLCVNTAKQGRKYTLCAGT